jgi:hypothetical protein
MRRTDKEKKEGKEKSSLGKINNLSYSRCLCITKKRSSSNKEGEKSV